MGWDKKHSQFILDAMKWKLVLILRDKEEAVGLQPNEDLLLETLGKENCVQVYDLQTKEKRA